MLIATVLHSDCDKFSRNGGHVAATTAFIATHVEAQLAMMQVFIAVCDEMNHFKTL